MGCYLKLFLTLLNFHYFTHYCALNYFIFEI